MRILKLIILIAIFSYSNKILPQLSLPSVFGDKMVLQRNSNVPVWGWATPGKTVQIRTSWNDNPILATAREDGKWKIILTTPELKGSQEIQISARDTIILNNVLLGEVWLASGQSNMEWSAAAGIENAKRAIAGADNPNIRFFTVPHRTSEKPEKNLQGEWVQSTPETMKDFSAVAYFFAKKLNKSLDVPIGIIHSSWGGTPAEAWTPEKAIINDPRLKKAASLLPYKKWDTNQPGEIYNGMIAPLIPYNIAGVIWYQGEANTPNAAYYQEVFSSLIRSWRDQWDDDFPFLFAQIAPFDYGENDWGVMIRDAQRRVLDQVQETAMVMTSDIGDTTDIHPKNKLDVGIRFANLALAGTYGKDIPAYPPLPKITETKNNRLILEFKNSEGLHLGSGEIATGFEIAGRNQIFHSANAILKGEQIILSSDQVKDPAYLRYAWGNTSLPNIFNAAGLPLTSFLIKIGKE